MNRKAVVVLLWAGLSGLVIFRDWSDQKVALQELVGIWLLSIGALFLTELSDDLGLVAEALLAADVLIRPGGKGGANLTAAALGSILPGAQGKPSQTQPQPVLVA